MLPEERLESIVRIVNEKKSVSNQELTALLPDYAWKGSEAASGTSFSGIAGGLAVAALCVLFCAAVRMIRKKK